MKSAAVLELGGPAGTLEVRLDEPDVPVRAGCVFAHPHPQHGGSLHSKTVFHASKALVRIGVACLRVNFRGVGRSQGTFDGGVGERDDFRAGLDFLAARYSGQPLWAAGFSFGSWIAWNSALDDPRVSLLLGIGLPVNLFDFSPARHSSQATFLVHGERDDIVPLREIRRFYATLSEPKELAVIDAADHSFDGKTEEVGEAIEDLLADWPTDTQGENVRE